jgi:EpsI family protein
MTLGGLTIPVRRLVTVLGPRNEPITYWVTHGDEATISAWRRRLISIRYGLRRQIPDGMLVRVSSIDRSQSQAFEMQQKFLADLVAALTPAGRDLVLGSVSAPPDA